MSPEFFHDTAVVGAMKVLPSKMDSLAARAMIVAICLQESELRSRRQVNGPARGYAQFESGGGVKGVLAHMASASHARVVCAALDIEPVQGVVYVALEYNDILAAAFARLLLWTLPNTLPVKEDPEGAWQQYFAAWRPGKPHRETWDAYYAQAWDVIEGALQKDELGNKKVKLREAAISYTKSLLRLQDAVTKLEE